MAHFDRFDICEAHLALENDYHSSGMLHERPSNQRRKESTAVQLCRIGFRPGMAFDGFKSLSDNGKEIYVELERRYNLHSGNVTEFEVLDHGEDGSQYFPGCGVGHFAHVATGVGDTAKEALEDALESMAQADARPSEVQEWEMHCALSDPDKSAHDSLDAHNCEDNEACADWYHYVSIRYSLRGEE